MNSAPLERLKEIFHSARELQLSERADFLTDACRSDEQLRGEVEALLESDRAPDDFIADPPARLVADAFGSSPDPSDAGRMIGHYKLLDCIGSGGMGAVYLAERADQQFQMQVAIKLIKRGMDTDSVLRRFQHERQILASLEHPNIARLLDGGTTEDGVPYFVMEYIEGQRIDGYAEEHRLPISERLDLFRQVCGAVSYAHQRLVVHRDLKPSNVLVTPAGVPKLLDFGIAKIIQPNDSAEALPTITVIPIMTPEYASPEQIEGAPATTLSDVYSLGAVLYELLAGQPPYRLQNRSPQEIEKAITAQIEKPSAVVSRPEDARRLRGDLDNIVRMAMRRETARRYRSVEQFSEDIRRHLAGRPVVAQPDTLSYRSAKFLRRNRLAVSAAALLFLTLVGGIVATAWQARRATIQEHRARAEQARAERRFNDVRKLANSVLFDYHDAIKDLPGATKVRERLVKDALTYLDSLVTEAHDDPALERELASAYDRVGDVRGQAYNASFGDRTGAQESYEKALRVRKALVATEAANVEDQRNLATSYRKVGNQLRDTTEAARGLEQLRQALAIYSNLAAEQPGNSSVRHDLADVYNDIGSALEDRNEMPAALEHHRQGLAIREELLVANPTDRVDRRGLSLTYENIGRVLALSDDLPGALENNARAMALREMLRAEDPVNADYRRILAISYQNNGDYRAFLKDTAGALASFRNKLTLDEQSFAADPANDQAIEDLAYSCQRMGELLAQSEEHSTAVPFFERALEMYERNRAIDSHDVIISIRVSLIAAHLGEELARVGNVAAAHKQCARAGELLQSTPDDPTNINERRTRLLAHAGLGDAYVALATNEKQAANRDSRAAALLHYQHVADIVQQFRERGIANADDLDAMADVARKTAECEKVLIEKE